MLLKDKLFIYFKVNSFVFVCLRFRIYTDRQGRGLNRWKCVLICSFRFLKYFMNIGVKYLFFKQRFKGIFLYKYLLSVWWRVI